MIELGERSYIKVVSDESVTCHFLYLVVILLN